MASIFEVDLALKSSWRGVLDLGAGRYAAPAPQFWFSEVLPQLRSRQRPREFVTSAGDAIYVPPGWWHCVLRLGMGRRAPGP